MTVHELNRDQLIELKQQYLMDMSADGSVSYDEMANADEIVSDDTIFRAYGYVQFSPDDFACSAGEDVDSEYQVVINVRATTIEDALAQTINAVREGDTRAIMDGCDFEIIER